MGQESSLYASNNTIDIIGIEELDDKNRVYLMSFFRRVGLLHVYWERVLPTFRHGQSLIVAAMSARPWPPYGSGSQRIIALCHAYHKSADSVYLSALWVGNENLTNIGLMSAVYKEMLDRLIKRGTRLLTYVVHDGSIWVRRVLERSGFEKTQEPYLTEDGRYTMYQTDVNKVLHNLELADTSSETLLNHTMNDRAFEQLGLFHGALQLATRLQPHEVLSKPDGGVPDGNS
jgi:hypothetical protein